MHILHVVGARPNFMKAAPLLRALAARPGVDQKLVHTGQHYDAAMSDIFFRQLEMPEPDFNLEVGSGSHAQQTAAIMAAFEPVVLQQRPDFVVVYGDVNSTMAAALVCSKLNIRVAHVEAGLRSRDRNMPEEINRLLTDQLSDLLFTPSADADINLQNEGINRDKIHLVGNVMIDTLVRLLPRAAKNPAHNFPSPYSLVTLHRPSNVDDLPWLQEMLATLAGIGDDLTVVFPVHPRTRKRLDEIHASSTSMSRTLMSTKKSSIHFLEPLPYLEFLALQRDAAIVITDSGGIQEETSFLGTPCLTVRENTERPITVELGTNQLVGRDLQRLRAAAKEILAQVASDKADKKGRELPPQLPLWDGRAADRIADIIGRPSGR
jgi:UDP-N-acetylglucosamine 2-epimerase (non-hydrolysing)